MGRLTFTRIAACRYETAGRNARAPMSERVLQCQLKLAHRDCRCAAHHEPLTRGIGRRSRKWRTRENVPIAPIPRKVLQRVERFYPELDDVLCVLSQMELP